MPGAPRELRTTGWTTLPAPTPCHLHPKITGLAAVTPTTPKPDPQRHIADHEHGLGPDGRVSDHWYRLGCDDPLCVEAAAIRKQNIRDQRRTERYFDPNNGGWVSKLLSSYPPGVGDGPWHGTRNGYNEYSCRCLTVPGTTRDGCGVVGPALYRQERKARRAARPR